MENTNALRQQFSQVLDEIRHDVVRMGTRANELVKHATEAALNGDLELAEQVIRNDDEIDLYEEVIHKRAVLTVMQEAPVAADFRFLVSAMGVVGEIEKAADDAVKLARRATKLSGQFPAELRVALVELGEESRKMFNAALRLFAEYSPELALEIISADKEVDTRYTTARNRVIDMIRENPENSENLVRTIDSFHALEHIADHAVEIARRMRMLYEARPS
ncbi:MAG: phosphate signaling complex protein PhoU [Chlorobia bacterium]|nr:phosphate signaling complex protein PhoU [Fimbriimonadaceae bacterium]